MSQEWQPSGYGYNVAARVGVTVTPGIVEQIASAQRTAPSPEQPNGFTAACLTCHEEDVIRQQRLTRAQWDREIAKMQGWGAEFDWKDRDRFLDYLFQNFGPRR
jgi:hypothetical protein